MQFRCVEEHSTGNRQALPVKVSLLRITSSVNLPQGQRLLSQADAHRNVGDIGREVDLTFVARAGTAWAIPAWAASHASPTRVWNNNLLHAANPICHAPLYHLSWYQVRRRPPASPSAIIGLCCGGQGCGAILRRSRITENGPELQVERGFKYLNRWGLRCLSWNDH